MIRLFEQRFNESYDITSDINHMYVSWMQECHPESVPSLATIFSDVAALELDESVSGITQ